MNVVDALHTRRSYRALGKVSIADSIVEELAHAAHSAPSCFNNQPWRFIFIRDEKVLSSLHSVYSQGNEWARNASMVIAVVSKKELDCVIKEREYYQFDTGISVGILMLRAVELGLVTHAIAGFNVAAGKELLHIPSDYDLITLIIAGKKGDPQNSILSDEQKAIENEPAQRMPLDAIRSFNIFMQEKE